jgi:hypothetical protein
VLLKRAQEQGTLIDFIKQSEAVFAQQAPGAEKLAQQAQIIKQKFSDYDVLLGRIINELNKIGGE